MNSKVDCKPSSRNPGNWSEFETNRDILWACGDAPPYRDRRGGVVSCAGGVATDLGLNMYLCVLLCISYFSH